MNVEGKIITFLKEYIDYDNYKIEFHFRPALNSI